MPPPAVGGQVLSALALAAKKQHTAVVELLLRHHHHAPVASDGAALYYARVVSTDEGSGASPDLWVLISRVIAQQAAAGMVAAADDAPGATPLHSAAVEDDANMISAFIRGSSSHVEPSHLLGLYVHLPTSSPPPLSASPAHAQTVTPRSTHVPALRVAPH